jgi:serine/threonine protein kinase
MKAAHSSAMKSRSGVLAAVSRPAPPRKRSRGPEPERFDLDLGQKIGRDLTVTKQLSAGPHTEIYQVWSTSRLCYFACKVLRAHVPRMSPEARHLALERALLRKLSHPNIVRAYDSDPAATLPHVLMDYLAGPSLLERLAASPRRRLATNEALRIAIHIGGALEHLHARSYIYRDLKPANIIERSGVPVLIDFGAAYPYRPGRSARHRVGTDPYMAPEQCLGEPLSPATDVFGLGAVLYEMLTGEWPYEDQLMNIFDRTRLENRFPQIKHAPGSLRRRAPNAGPDLERVVHRCLDRDPNERYQSIADVVADLSSFLRGEHQLIPGAAA